MTPPPASPRRPQSARHRGCLLSLLLGLSLLACQPEKPAPAGSSAEQLRQVMAQVETLERRLRSHPEQVDDALIQLEQKTEPGSAERLDILSVRSSTVSYLPDGRRHEQLLQELAHWPANALEPQVRLVTACAKGRRTMAVQQDLSAGLAQLNLLDSFKETDAAPALLLRCYLLRARNQQDVGELEAAIRSAHQALKLAELSGRSWYRATALSTLASAYQTAEQFDQAQAADDEAMTEALKDPDPFLLYQLNNARGIIYSTHKDYRVSELAVNKALEYARETGADDLVALALVNSSDFYLRRKNFQQALERAQESLVLARKMEDIGSEFTALHNQGIALIGLGKIELGKQTEAQGLALAMKQGASRSLLDLHKELGEALEAKGDLAGAVQAFHAYRKYSDQVFREEMRKSTLEAQESLDAERRNREIELLNRDVSLKNEQLRASQLELRLWLSLGGCILVSAALLVLAYRRVRQTHAALLSSNERLKIQSERDPLTGLANRRHFQAVIRQHSPNDRLIGTMFLIDIDHFKRVNDQYGHAAGDSVLVEVAKRLRSALREEDLVVRWGGEEFLIVVKASDAGYAQLLAQRLLDLIGRRPVAHEQRDIQVSASIGFASLPLPPQQLSLHWERAIDLVDTLMYMAKAHGRNKAYGLQWAEADDESALLRLTEQMEQAWQEERVHLMALSGPPLWQESRQ